MPRYRVVLHLTWIDDSVLASLEKQATESGLSLSTPQQLPGKLHLVSFRIGAKSIDEVKKFVETSPEVLSGALLRRGIVADVYRGKADRNREAAVMQSPGVTTKLDRTPAEVYNFRLKMGYLRR